MEDIKGKVTIPPELFNRTARKEYTFWPRALLREFLQNSVDAGSTEIKFTFNKERLTLSVKDNGCGMTKDIILNKLLSLGGSHKKENSVGGFGKAKEILFFAWKSYAIHTNNFLVNGKGADYFLKKISQYHYGTHCVIKFYNEEEFNSVRKIAKAYLVRNEIKPDIYLNNEKIYNTWIRKKKVKSFKWADAYISAGSRYGGVSVRARGMEMFRIYAAISLNKNIIIELKGTGIEALASNRDCLKSLYASDLQKFIENLSINPISSMINFNEDEQEVIRNGRELKMPSSLSIINGNDLLPPIDFGFKVKADKESKLKLNIGHDFIIRVSKNFDRNIVRDFVSDPIAVPLAKIWSSTLFEIAIANKIQIQVIRPGFVFSNEVCGLCLSNPKRPIILINPLARTIINNIDKGGKFILDYLEDIAYHELAHIFRRQHDEKFSLKMSKYRVNHRVWKHACNSK